MKERKTTKPAEDILAWLSFVVVPGSSEVVTVDGFTEAVTVDGFTEAVTVVGFT